MSLIQQWKCQDNAASTTVVATVGNNVTLLGGSNTADISIVAGPGTAFLRSFNLDGTDDCLDISGASVSFASGSAWSVAGWFNAANFTLGRPLFGIDFSDTCRAALIVSTPLAVVNLNSGTNRSFTIPAVSGSTWYHLLVTHSAADATRVFWNGAESSTGSITVAEAFGPNRVGQAATAFMNGAICDIRVYNSDESANAAAIMAQKDLQNSGMFFGM